MSIGHGDEASQGGGSGRELHGLFVIAGDYVDASSEQRFQGLAAARKLRYLDVDPAGVKVSQFTCKIDKYLGRRLLSANRQPDVVSIT